MTHRPLRPIAAAPTPDVDPLRVAREMVINARNALMEGVPLSERERVNGIVPLLGAAIDELENLIPLPH